MQKQTHCIKTHTTLVVDFIFIEPLPWFLIRTQGAYKRQLNTTYSRNLRCAAMQFVSKCIMCYAYQIIKLGMITSFQKRMCLLKKLPSHFPVGIIFETLKTITTSIMYCLHCGYYYLSVSYYFIIIIVFMRLGDDRVHSSINYSVTSVQWPTTLLLLRPNITVKKSYPIIIIIRV